MTNNEGIHILSEYSRSVLFVYKDVEIKLSQIQFYIFQALVQNTGRYMTSDELVQVVYSDYIIDEWHKDALMVHVRYLRLNLIDKLGFNPIKSKRIKGYVIPEEG